MRLRRTSIAITAGIMTLAAMAAVESAAAQIVRQGGLVAVESDAPQSLRTKRRDVSSSRAAGGGSNQDKVAFGEQLAGALAERRSGGSQPSTRNMRGSGMRGMDGGRTNGGMGRR
jgi:hypothetical protein